METCAFCGWTREDSSQLDFDPTVPMHLVCWAAVVALWDHRGVRRMRLSPAPTTVGSEAWRAEGARLMTGADIGPHTARL